MITFVLVIIAGIVAASGLALIYWGALVLIRPFLDRFRRSIKPRGNVFILIGPSTLMSERADTFSVIALPEFHTTGNIRTYSEPEALSTDRTLYQIG
jgi:hypothetical protein